MNEQVGKFLGKSKQWQKEMEKLRALVLSTKLDENFKWGLPCYSHNQANIVIIQPFKSCLGLMFFKGTLLKDSKKLLINNGPNSQAAKRFEFRSLLDVTKNAASIKSYIKEAIDLEESGQKVEFKKKPQSAPDELKKMFVKNAKLKKAFGSLTPGRQRAYLMHFSDAKQSITRQARIEKCVPRILNGKGLTDR